MFVFGCLFTCLLWSFMAAEKIELPSVVLNNGLTIPALALGTYLGWDQDGPVSSKNKELKDAVGHAIDLGYRHIDTAAIYTTEQEIGEALKEAMSNGTITRDDIFITTKVWMTDHERSKVTEAARASLTNLQLDYVDLYLMHWPMAMNADNTYSSVDYMETWRGLEDVQKLGLAKSIGVSNFNRSQLERVLKEGEIKPAVLQIEVHPNLVQEDLVAFAQTHGIVVMGYCPLGYLTARGAPETIAPSAEDPILSEIAKKYGKSTYQIVLRWQVDRKIIPIPKTVHRDRLQQNIDIFDFKLTDEEVTKIGTSYDRHRIVLPSFWQDHVYYPFEKVDKPIANPFAKKN